MTESPSGSPPVIRITAMPADANSDGNILGSWLMGHMDLAACSVGSRRAFRRTVTIAVERMKVLQLVSVGDEVSFYAALLTTGTSSMTIDVEAWRRAHYSDDAHRVTQARFVLVAIDKARRTQAITAR